MTETRAGKTAPRLAVDIRNHSPDLLISSRQPRQTDPAWGKAHNNPANLLRDPPPGYDQSYVRTINVPPTCRHIFGSKSGQCVIPPQTLDIPESDSKWQYAAVCQRCRWHLTVTAHYNPILGNSGPYCPSEGFPVHHFVLSECSTDRNGRTLNEGSEKYTFKCTNCPVTAIAEYLRPRLSEDWIALLTDQSKLKRRCDKLREADPDRQNLFPAKAVNVLEALSAYLRDALTRSSMKNRIPKANRRFSLSFGEDCDAFLRWLGFTDEDDSTYWTLPCPPDSDPFGPYTKRQFLEDVREEVLSRLRDYPESERQSLKQFSPSEWVAVVDNGLERVLASSVYRKLFNLRKSSDVNDMDAQAYEALGALWDFSDDLLMFAFEQQALNDPAHSIYYYDRLLTLSSSRGTEALQIAVATKASEGFVSSHEVEDAYRYFTIDSRAAPQLNDDHILGLFQSRLADSGALHEAELRRRLRVIGQARGSAKLTNAADNIIQTPAQALHWLGADLTVDDSSVIVAADTKISDNPSQREMVHKAVALIANQRQSPFLLDWLQNGTTSGGMSLDDDELAAAYRFFNIANRSEDINLDILESQLAIAVEDDFAQAELARKHYDVLRRYTENKQRGAMAGSTPDYTRPVGLVNMGNTCYLNCLLQYLYAIEPVRNTVLDFDQLRSTFDTENFSTKSVLNTKIGKREVEEAQDFVGELGGLFRNMVHAPEPVIRPSWKLASQALSQGSSAPVMTRRLTLGNELPFGPQPKPDSVLADDGNDAIDEEMTSSLDSVKPLAGSPGDISDVTLIEEPVDLGEPAINIQGSAESSPPTIVEMSDARPPTPPLKDKPAPPARPPPIPPRPNAPKREENLQAKAEEAALQQDVTEVTLNVLFKIMCALTPEGTDASGGQIDRIKDLFWGKHLYTYTQHDVKDKEEEFSTIVANLSAAPKDIYAGLDTHFDIEDLVVDGKPNRRYPVLTKVPPILQVYIQRQGYDKEKGTHIIKHHMQLEEVIYMDRYMADGPPDLRQRRERAYRAQQELKQLQEQKSALANNAVGLDKAETMEALWQFVDDIGDELSVKEISTLETGSSAATQGTNKDTNGFQADELGALGQALKSKSASFEQEKQHLDSLIAGKQSTIASQFHDLTAHPYTLAAIFVHRGSGGSRGGHYWIYIRDFAANVWRRYEDRDVKEVVDPGKEVFGEADPETVGAPYFVVYVDATRKEMLVEALCRGPSAVAEDGDSIVHGGDTPMPDVETSFIPRTAQEQVDIDVKMRGEDILGTPVWSRDYHT